MLPLFHGRKVTASGQLSVLLRTAAIPASLQRMGGWAMDASGQPYVDTGAIASDRVFNQGIAFTPDGAMYVTSDAPTSTSIRIGGVAVSSDGAVHYTPDTQPLSGGIGLSADGRISIGGGAIPWDFSEVIDYYDARYGITEDVGVASWAPTLKGTHTLEQATDANQPAWTDGNSILFDGSNDFLQAAFAYAQPATFVLVVKQVSWTDLDYMMDGASPNTAAIYQNAVSPRLYSYSGDAGGLNAGLAVGAVGIVSVTFNGASSRGVRVNLGTAAAGPTGSSGPDGLTVGAYSTGAQNGHIQVYAIAVCGAITEARENELIAAMNAVYGVF